MRQLSTAVSPAIFVYEMEGGWEVGREGGGDRSMVHSEPEWKRVRSGGRTTGWRKGVQAQTFSCSCRG
jgi:hypothetical protein